MYCPQCGAPNQEKASSCQNCGVSLTNKQDLDDKFPGEGASAATLVMSIASPGIALLALWPYPYLAIKTYFPITRNNLYLPGAVDFGCLGGLPLGLLGMGLGVLAWRRSQGNRFVMTLAVCGILSGIGAIAGHVWFFLTCQFCQ